MDCYRTEKKEKLVNNRGGANCENCQRRLIIRLAEGDSLLLVIHLSLKDNAFKTVKGT